jgi:putative ABC transport system permease protein
LTTEPVIARFAIFGLLLKDALRTLHTVRQRSMLAIGGIMIGTAAVIALVNIGDNAEQEALGLFRAMGTDVLVIQKNPVGAPQFGISIKDVLDMPELVPGVGSVAPTTTTGVRLTSGSRSLEVPVVGTTEALRSVAGLQLADGRFVSEYDEARTVAVIGSDVVQQLRRMGMSLSLGDLVSIGEHGFTVIGVLAPAISNPLLPADLNRAMLIPLSTAKRITSNPGIMSVVIRAKVGTDEEKLGSALVSYFQDKPRGQAVNVRTAHQLIATITQQKQIYSRLLSAVAAISLIVGGVGIMNVMLMSAIERRREIGLRMALGARRRDIRTMFLVEALTLSVIGGLLGTALGLSAAVVFAETSQWSFRLADAAVPLGVGMSALVGIVFGLYPAVSAARLDPIVALRAD